MRSGFVESRHHGSVVVLAPGGERRVVLGDVDSALFPRSCNKPLQATGMLRAGLDLPPDQLAVAAASHSGEPVHVATVRALLAGAGVPEEALGCPAMAPLDVEAARDVAASGSPYLRVHMDCSGKHAAMLATCVANGWALDGYLDEQHPLQVALRAAVGELAGEPVARTAVDGCGAPIFALSLVALARGFARLATAPDGTPEARVAAAMRTHPELVGGTGREVTRAMRAVPGLITKDGAEGCLAGALPDGSAFALKVADGGQRARGPLLAEVLRLLGAGGDESELAALAAPPVLGGGVPVGHVRALRLG